MKNTKLNILFVCSASYVFGAELSVLSVIAGLQERGHKVLCLTNSWNDGDFISRLESRDILYREIPVGAISKSLQPKHIRWTIDALLHLPKAYYQFWCIQKDFAPDLIIFNGTRTLSTLIPVVDLNRTLLYVRSTPKGSLHFRRVQRRLGEAGGGYIAISEFVKGRLVENGVRKQHIHTIYNAVEQPDKISSSKSTYPTIGIVGQIGDWKGHRDLVEALNLLRRGGHSFRCRIVGSGDEEYINSLKAQVREYSLTDYVEWAGYLADSTDIYGPLDIVAVPSRVEETFGRVAAESAMHALPVVATRRGGLQEIVVDGETGYLVDTESPAQLAARLRILITNSKLRKQMGKAAQIRAEQEFSIERMIDEVDDLAHRFAVSRKCKA